MQFLHLSTACNNIIIILFDYFMMYNVMDYIKTVIRKYFSNYIIYIKVDSKRYKKLKKGLNYKKKTISSKC